MGTTELSILPIADETHHVTLPGHEWWLRGLLWRKGLWPTQKGAAALTRLCHLMTLAPDTATSGCLSWPVTTMLWWTTIHQLSSAGRIIKRFPLFQDPPYHHVCLWWLRKAWSDTIPQAKAECVSDSRVELPITEWWCCLVHFGGQVSNYVAFHCLQLETARGLSCDGKGDSIAPDMLSHGWYRLCSWCSHSAVDFMQLSGEWDKETPQTTTKLHKPLLGCCTFPGTVMKRMEEDKASGKVWTNVTYCLPSASNWWRRHVCSIRYQRHWPGVVSKEMFTKTGKETICPFPRLTAAAGTYMAQLDLKHGPVDQLLRKPAPGSLNSHAGLRPCGSGMQKQT